MLKLLKQDAQIGDTLNLYLTTGEMIKGRIIELDDNCLLLEVDGSHRRYFPQIIGGWNVVRNSSLEIEAADKDSTDNEDFEGDSKEEDDELKELL